MATIANFAVLAFSYSAYQAAAANKGLLEVNLADEGGYVAYGVEVLKDTLRNSAIAVAAALVAHYVIENAPLLGAILPSVPAEVLSFGATVWTAVTSLGAKAAAVIAGVTLPQVAIVLAVVAAVSLVIGGTYLIYKKTRPTILVVTPVVDGNKPELPVKNRKSTNPTPSNSAFSSPQKPESATPNKKIVLAVDKDIVAPVASQTDEKDFASSTDSI